MGWQVKLECAKRNVCMCAHARALICTRVLPTRHTQVMGSRLTGELLGSALRHTSVTLTQIQNKWAHCVQETLTFPCKIWQISLEKSQGLRVPLRRWRLHKCCDMIQVKCPLKSKVTHAEIDSGI